MLVVDLSLNGKEFMSDPIKYHCSPGLLTIHYLDTLSQADEKMKKFSIRHLPVVDDSGIVVGILSDRDLKRPTELSGTNSIDLKNRLADLTHSSVYKLMNWSVESIDEQTSSIEAARLTINKKISSLVVTKDQVAVAIITTEDLLQNLLPIHENDAAEINAFKVKYYNSSLRTVVDALASVGI